MPACQITESGHHCCILDLYSPVYSKILNYIILQAKHSMPATMKDQFNQTKSHTLPLAEGPAECMVMLEMQTSDSLLQLSIPFGM